MVQRRISRAKRGNRCVGFRNPQRGRTATATATAEQTRQAHTTHTVPYIASLPPRPQPDPQFLIFAVKRAAQRIPKKKAADYKRGWEKELMRRVVQVERLGAWSAKILTARDQAAAAAADQDGPKVPKLSGHRYTLKRATNAHVFEALSNGIGGGCPDDARLNAVVQAGALECHTTLSIPSLHLVVHCEKAGSHDRLRSWLKVSWEGSGDVAARLEALFELEVGGDKHIYGVVRSLGESSRLAMCEGIPFERAQLLPPDQGLYVVRLPDAITERALVFPDMDAGGWFWVVPEVEDWPDVLSSAPPPDPPRPRSSTTRAPTRAPAPAPVAAAAAAAAARRSRNLRTSTDITPGTRVVVNFGREGGWIEGVVGQRARIGARVVAVQDQRRNPSAKEAYCVRFIDEPDRDWVMDLREEWRNRHSKEVGAWAYAS